MVTLNKIYTKTGDEGLTSLGDGSRISKNNIRSKPMVQSTRQILLSELSDHTQRLQN